MDEVNIDIYSDDFHNNLYETYAKLRHDVPVFFDKKREVWMLTRYEDVRKALRNDELFRSSGTSQDFVPQLQAIDGFEHKRIRKEVISKFSQKVSSEISPHIKLVVEELFLSINKSGKIDILNEVIKKIPQKVMSHFMGFPDHLRFRWYEIGEPMVGLDPKNPSQPSETLFQDMIDIIDEAVAYKRIFPGDDLLSYFIDNEIKMELNAGDTELIARTLGFAALDTTINLLANGTALLARFHLQRDLLIQKPELLNNAIEEMLRFDSPTQSLPRRLADDVELHGVLMKKNDEVSLLFGAANHDPEKYDKPEQFDINRKCFDHLAFGFGLHKCIGQHIARMEAQIFFEFLLRYLPNYKIVTARWMISPWARAYAELMIKAT
ncbi:MAG: hypothetical protein CL691_06890 [Cellvibrionales bacterium]|nr:hypothetical protein [Cellvibrionales bacterium]|tara:strand:- start:4454 stop:5590 length:1137 start_codon:yes stop_codon:yes gene_type:complete